MSLLNRLSENKLTFSFEFFPPKKDMPIGSVYEAIEKLAAYNPAFVSVTYGAGGGNKDRAIDIASHIKSSGLEAIAHLTCVASNSQSVHNFLKNLQANGITNILALRGDVPEGIEPEKAFTHFKHASDLITEIKKTNGFTLGAAAYPESHVESETLDDDIKYMRVKEELGANFFITQLCFDKYALSGFHEKVTASGIKAPVLTGIMPVLNPNQITKMALLSACSIPAPLSKIICKYGNNADDFKKAGLEYAINEIEFLIDNGIRKFHIYTMNKPENAEQIILGSRLKSAI